MLQLQYSATGSDGKFDLQFLSLCGSTKNCLSRSILEIHSHVAVTLSNQQTNSVSAVNLHVVGKAGHSAEIECG